MVRRLRDGDVSAVALARSAGVHGVYLQNALALGWVDGMVFELRGAVALVAWFGPRGNLVLVSTPAIEGREDEVAREIVRRKHVWRIALGAGGLIDSLACHVGRSVLAHRDQVYYVGGLSDARSSLVRDDVRAPEPGDRDRLARATLALNASDLNIAPERVDRRWLKRIIDERVRDGSTRVLGPVGELWSKLDFGSMGPGGCVFEGVYTFPDQRGRGVAASLVASCMAAADLETSLHVAEGNHAARRCYEHAGMRESGRCRLLLLA